MACFSEFTIIRPRDDRNAGLGQWYFRSGKFFGRVAVEFGFASSNRLQFSRFSVVRCYLGAFLMRTSIISGTAAKAVKA